MLSIHHTDSVSNDSTVAIGLDIGTYFGYSVTLFVLSLVAAVILVTWGLYICQEYYNNEDLDTYCWSSGEQIS